MKHSRHFYLLQCIAGSFVDMLKFMLIYFTTDHFAINLFNSSNDALHIDYFAQESCKRLVKIYHKLRIFQFATRWHGVTCAQPTYINVESTREIKVCGTYKSDNFKTLRFEDVKNVNDKNQYFLFVKVIKATRSINFVRTTSRCFLHVRFCPCPQ